MTKVDSLRELTIFNSTSIRNWFRTRERESMRKMEEEEEEIIKPYELNFSDLILLSSDKPLSSFSLASEEIERLQSITSTIMENLGPRGPGLIVITGVANASTLRRTLLPLARKLSLLNFDDRKLVLKVSPQF